jgi:predicted phosphodiesterase
MSLEKQPPLLYGLGMGNGKEIIGIMGDSHGKNGLLASAMELLRSMGARTLVHLGDMCDTLAPHLMEETFSLLRGNGVLCVRGNNECQMVHDLHSARDGLPQGIGLLEALPYTLNIGTCLFTHSVPYAFPAATRRPVTEFLPALPGDLPFSILFRGHSHRPSMLRAEGGSWEKIPFDMDRDIPLDRDLRHIITVGAVERGSCLLFLPVEHCVRFIAVPGH